MITRNQLTAAMKSDNRLQAVNAIISPDKELAPHKGALLERISVTPDGCFSYLILPQWVKLDNPERPRGYAFRCTESGAFIEWLNSEP